MHYKKIYFIVLLFLTSLLANGQSKLLNPKETSDLLKKGHEYFKNANFENSLKTLRVALYNSIQLKNDSLTAKIYNRIGRNFGELSEDEKALTYLNKGLDYAKKANDKTTELTICINIANIYSFDKKISLKKSIDFYKKTLLLSEKLQDTSSNLTINTNIAWTLIENDKFDESFQYLNYVNTNFDKHGYTDLFPSLCMLNGIYFSSKNKDKEAKAYFEKGINSGKEIILKEDKQDLYLAYSKFLYKTGNNKAAYENLKIANKIEAELFDKNKLKRANVAGINFEMDEYKREITKIESEKKQQAKQLKNSKTISFLFLVIAIIFGLLLFMLYRNIRNKIKSNKKLAASNNELTIAKEIAEEATKVKSQFVSTITHELRTPLYGVIGMTDILQDENKELEDNPHLKSLKFSAQYLLSLVNDILKINKLEENTTSLESNSINLKSEIESINNSLSFLVQKNNNKLSYIIDKSIPETLIGDKLRLTQILINLVGNALKFTKNGEVSISVLLNKIVDKSYFIEFKIKDNGTGIAIEDQQKIFEKFVQVGRKDEDYQGTGLGLSIVKKLLDLYQSEIKLESTIGIGTTFSFIIALENDLEKTNKITESNKIDIPKSENYTILVVEDNKINQVVTKKIIEKNLGNCVVANDGYEALSILENQTFDIILMDINMPGIDGYQTSIKIRETGNKTPIIALTASSKDQIRDKITASGINDIIVKPFEPVVLYDIIKRNI
jgi:signal transduction histidine kinase/CheY-like chemotaxis protein